MALSRPLLRVRPESVGIAPSSVTDFMKAASDSPTGLHSFMLLRHGRVAAEAHWRPYDSALRHMLFSLSKSFTSTAIGLAVAERLLTVDDAVISFFPEKRLNDGPNMRAMRVRHLLSMSTGHAEDAMGRLRGAEDGDWVQSFLSLEVEHEPGTRFVYNSGASYMLSAIIQRVTGQPLLDYLQPRLLAPLGIDGAEWETCPRGIHAGGWGLSLMTEDIARFGQLYLQQGQWEGAQLLPKAWVKEATSRHIANGDGGESDWKQGYGYQFWICRHGAYRGDGAYGQFCVVLPEQEAVIAITSGVRKNLQDVLDLVWTHLLPGMKQGELPPDDEQFGIMTDTAQSLAYAPLQSDLKTDTAAKVSGAAYVMDANDHYKTISFRFEPDLCRIAYTNGAGEHQIQCGMGRWAIERSPLDSYPMMAASGQWLEADTFEMEWRRIETPFIIHAVCKFAGDRASIQIRHQVNKIDVGEPILLAGTKER
ncbi:6-aminohexanoate-dimer hydrolase [Paenibacillus konkukensis]|uniref:6-aminohexanoate-dimer hydrolase n=1 Tax=Paenibacillus konkukensis TaxID=2020716 RepID=A0ABY4RJW0_9BACL|nr:serine hydrolase [Paenibacillus konkukensis]UQZ82151.1 6-aminohexanoate-dimer hydrolase [Paenibacillus konkukensis]